MEKSGHPYTGKFPVSILLFEAVNLTGQVLHAVCSLIISGVNSPFSVFQMFWQTKRTAVPGVEQPSELILLDISSFRARSGKMLSDERRPGRLPELFRLR